jgi:HK97 family phage major capsid protein
MKNKLKARLDKLEARKKQLLESVATASEAELRSMMPEIENINGDITELRSMIDSCPDETHGMIPGMTPPAQGQRNDEPAAGSVPGNEQRGMQPPTPAQILATFGAGAGQVPGQQQRSQEPEDPYATVEYRSAFMNFAKFGQVTPELRIDAMTTVSEVSAIIPTTILNEVIRKITQYGQIFSRVRKLNIKGGVQVPILSLKPTATWITEATVSDKKKVTANTSISFTYFGLECKVSVSLLADTTSLSGFETTVTDLIVEAMAIGMDKGVISGTGSGQMLGITADNRVPAGQIITLTSADFTDWSAWKKNVFAKMPLAYKAGATFIMASGTFEGYIDGMVDANGQPIGRVNYGITEGAQERFGGKEVILVEDDVVANYDDASTDDVVAIYCNLKNYGLNSNMQMTMFRYFDHDTNEWIDKAILICDGKLIDPNGCVIIKKGA